MDKRRLYCSGNDAYIFVDRANLSMVDENDKNLPPEYGGYAFHCIIGTKASRVRDLFDQDKEIHEQVVRLLAPGPSQTLLARQLAEGGAVSRGAPDGLSPGDGL